MRFTMRARMGMCEQVGILEIPDHEWEGMSENERESVLEDETWEWACELIEIYWEPFEKEDR